MYRLMRNTHLVSGLFSCLFLMIYGASSVRMVHGSWFSEARRVTERVVRVEAAPDARSLARELMDRHGVRGEIRNGRATPAGFRLTISRPGTVYEIDYARASGQARIKTSVANFGAMLAAIHHAGGFRHEYPVMHAWGILVALVSLALVVLAATGIYMWFKLHPERRVGGFILLLGLSYSIPLMLLLRLD